MIEELHQQKNWKVKVYLLGKEGNWNDYGAGQLSLCKEMDEKTEIEQEFFKVLQTSGENNDITQQDYSKLKKLTEKYVKHSPPQTPGSTTNGTQQCLLYLRVNKFNDYDKQGDSIITWVDNDIGEEVALSFLDNTAATETWRHICQTIGKNPNEEPSYNEEELNKLPMPTAANLQTIGENPEFMDELCNVFQNSEDLEEIEQLTQGEQFILFIECLNRYHIYEILCISIGLLLQDLVNQNTSLEKKNVKRQTLIHVLEVQTYFIQIEQQRFVTYLLNEDKDQVRNLKAKIPINRYNDMQIEGENQPCDENCEVQYEEKEVECHSEILLQYLGEIFVIGEIGMQVQIGQEIIKMLLEPTQDKKNYIFDKIFSHFIPVVIKALKQPKKCSQFTNCTIQFLEILILAIKNNYHFKMNEFLVREKFYDILKTLLKLRDKAISLQITKFYRTIFFTNGDKNEQQYIKYILKKSYLDQILELFIYIGNRSNLINSSLLELFKIIEQKNLKSTISYIVEKWIPKLKEKKLDQFFSKIVLKYEQNKDDPKFEAGTKPADDDNEDNNNMQSSREMEQYFDEDDEENQDNQKSQPSQIEKEKLQKEKAKLEKLKLKTQKKREQEEEEEEDSFSNGLFGDAKDFSLVKYSGLNDALTKSQIKKSENKQENQDNFQQQQNIMENSNSVSNNNNTLLSIEEFSEEDSKSKKDFSKETNGLEEEVSDKKFISLEGLNRKRINSELDDLDENEIIDIARESQIRKQLKIDNSSSQEESEMEMEESNQNIGSNQNNQQKINNGPVPSQQQLKNNNNNGNTQHCTIYNTEGKEQEYNEQIQKNQQWQEEQKNNIINQDNPAENEKQ